MHMIASIFGGMLLAIALFPIAFAVMLFLCSIARAHRPNGYGQRMRLPKQRVPRGTMIVTPEHKDPEIVGDVPRFDQARYPASRPNVRTVKG